MDLRDHDRPCEHGERMTHEVPAGPAERNEFWCPGGAKVEVDIDTATEELIEQFRKGKIRITSRRVWRENAGQIIAAALRRDT